MRFGGEYSLTFFSSNSSVVYSQDAKYTQTSVNDEYHTFPSTSGSSTGNFDSADQTCKQGGLNKFDLGVEVNLSTNACLAHSIHWLQLKELNRIALLDSTGDSSPRNG